MRAAIALLIIIILLAPAALAENNHVWFDTKDGPEAKSVTVYWGETERVPIYIRHNYTFIKKLDVVFAIDISGSMVDDLQQLRTQWNSILSMFSRFSQNDYRIAFVPYSGKQTLRVDESLVTAFLSSQTQVNEITQYVDQLPTSSSVGGGGGCREYTYDALYFIANRDWTTIPRLNCYPVGEACEWRDDALKVVYVVTDAGVEADQYNMLRLLVTNAYVNAGIYLFGITPGDKSACPPTCECKGGGSLCSVNEDCCSDECNGGSCSSPMDPCYDLSHAAPATGGQYYSGFHLSFLEQQLAKAFEDIDYNTFKVTLGHAGALTTIVDGLENCPSGEGKCIDLEVGECKTPEAHPCGKLFYLDVTAPDNTDPQSYSQSINTEIQGTSISESIELTVNVKVPADLTTDMRAVYDEGKTYVFFNVKNTGKSRVTPRFDQFELTCQTVEARLSFPMQLTDLDPGESFLGIGVCTDVFGVDEDVNVELTMSFGDAEQDQMVEEKSLKVTANPDIFSGQATYYPVGQRVDILVSGSGLEYALVRVANKNTDNDEVTPKKRTTMLQNISLSGISPEVMDRSDIIVYAKAGGAISRRRISPGHAYFDVKAPGTALGGLAGWDKGTFWLTSPYEHIMYSNASLPIVINTVMGDTFTLTVNNVTASAPIKSTDETKKFTMKGAKVHASRQNGTYDRRIAIELLLEDAKGTAEISLLGTKSSGLKVTIKYEIKYPYIVDVLPTLAIIPRRSASFSAAITNNQEADAPMELCAWGEKLTVTVDGQAVSDKTCVTAPSMVPGTPKNVNVTVTLDGDEATSLTMVARHPSEISNKRTMTVAIRPASFTESTMSASCKRSESQIKCTMQFTNSGNLPTSYYYGFVADGFTTEIPFAEVTGVKPRDTQVKTVSTEFLPYEITAPQRDIIKGLGKMVFLANLVLKDDNFTKTDVFGDSLDVSSLVGALEGMGEMGLATKVKALKDTPGQAVAASVIEETKAYIDAIKESAAATMKLTTRSSITVLPFIADKPVMVEGKTNVTFREDRTNVPFSLQLDTELEVPERIPAMEGDEVTFTASVTSLAPFAASFDILLTSSDPDHPTVKLLENQRIEPRGTLPLSIPIPAGLSSGEYKLYLKTRPHGTQSYTKSASSLLEISQVRSVDMDVTAVNTSVKGLAGSLPPFVFTITNTGNSEETFTVTAKSATDKVTIDPDKPQIKPGKAKDVTVTLVVPPEQTEDFQVALDVAPRSDTSKTKQLTFDVYVVSPDIRVLDFPTNITEEGTITFVNEGDGEGTVSVQLEGLNAECVILENATITLGPGERGTVKLTNACPDAGDIKVRAEAPGLSDSRDLSLKPKPTPTPEPTPEPTPTPIPEPKSSSKAPIIVLVLLALGSVGLVLSKKKKMKPGAKGATAAGTAAKGTPSAYAQQYPYKSSYMNSKYAAYYRQQQAQGQQTGQPQQQQAMTRQQQMQRR